MTPPASPSAPTSGRAASGPSGEVSAAQRGVVAFLASPESYDAVHGTGHGALGVETISTHLSHVFLAGDRVYKIKRAIKYPFADFSTVEQRRRACEAEVRINRRTAPRLYLRAAPIYYGENGFAWTEDEAGPGADPVEWAVVMARFDAAAQFDVMLRSGALEETHVKALGERIADFHLSAPRVIERRPKAEIAAVLDGLLDGLGVGEPPHDQNISYRDHLAARRGDDVRRFAARAREARQTLAPFLAARRRRGFVRRCHGDLHLANICLFEGAPTPFDAIEFNEDLATIDVLYDLAFVLMDLIAGGRRDFANLLMNRYLAVTRDYSGVKALAFFMALRAGVRAMVAELSGAAARADAYLDVALGCFQHTSFLHSAPRLIAVGGLSGTGKSTLARGLALDLGRPAGAIILRSDVARKRLAGAAPETRLGADQYGGDARERVYVRILRDADRALRAGATVILDATFLDQDVAAKARRVAERAGAAFAGLWLTAPDETLLARVAARPKGASDATVDVLRNQLRAGATLPAGWRSVDAGGDAAATLEDARRVLSAY